MRNFFFDCGVRERLASLALLLLRVGFGVTMFSAHGIQKIQQFEQLKDDWVVPAIFPFSFLSSPMSYVGIIIAEAVCSLLIVLGLATRFSAFIMGFAMCVAAFQVLGSAGLDVPGKELSIHYLIFSIVLIVSGSGIYSLDALIGKKKRKRLFS